MGKTIKISVVVLAVLLVLALGYISYDKYVVWKQKKDLSNFQAGAQFGYGQAITQLFQQAKSCKQVPIFYKNDTLNIVAVECLGNQ